MQKLLAGGKTDLLHRFISKKGRPFSAFLVRGADGKVGFEFAPRAAKPGKAAAEAPDAAAGAIKPAAKKATKSAAKPAAKAPAAPAAKKASAGAAKAVKSRKKAAR